MTRTHPPRKLASVGREALADLQSRIKQSPQDLGKHLTWLRNDKAELNRGQLAVLAGLRESTIQAIETRYPLCNQQSVQAVLRVFDLSLSALSDTQTSDFFQPIGEAICRARQERGWSHRQLCTQSGVARGTLKAVEEEKSISMSSLVALLSATCVRLNVTQALATDDMEDAQDLPKLRDSESTPKIDRYAPTLHEMLYGRSERYQKSSVSDI